MKRKNEEVDDVSKKVKSSSNSEESGRDERSTSMVTFTHEKLHEIIKDNNMNQVKEFLQNGCNICDQCIVIAESTNDWEVSKQLFEMYPKGIYTMLPNEQGVVMSKHMHYPERWKFILNICKNEYYKTSECSNFHELPIMQFAIRKMVPLSCIQYLIDNGFNLHTTISDIGPSPLMLASCNFNVDYVSALLSANRSCNLNFRDRKGLNVLHLTLSSRQPASEDSVLTTFTLLLKAFEKPHQLLDSDGKTLLMRACFHPHPKYGVAIVKLLIATGADLEAVDDDHNTALILACGLPAKNEFSENKAEIVQILLDAGANPNAATVQNNTPLLIATKLKNAYMSYKITKLLLTAGADIHVTNVDNETPLNCAASPKFGNCEYQLNVVKLLLETGAKATQIDFKSSPLLSALTQSSCYPVNSDVVKLLLVYGANPKIVTTHGKTALECVVNIKNGKIAWTVLKDLLDAGADPNENIRNTYIMNEMIEYPDPIYGPKMVKTLIAAGAEIDTTLSLFYALHSPEPAKIFRILLSAGANPNSEINSTTILMKSCRYLNSLVAVELVKLLIDAGADVNSTDRSGNTAMFHAISLTELLPGTKYGCPEIVKLLLTAGACPSVCNTRGVSPVMIVLQNKSVENLNVELFKLFVHHTGLDPKNSLNILLPQNYVDTELLKCFDHCVEQMCDGEQMIDTAPSVKIRTTNIALQGPSEIVLIEHDNLLLHHVLNEYSNADIGVQKLQNLLQLGADPNQKRSDGTTALLVACRINNSYGNVFVEKLLNYRANPSLQDNYGNSPLSETLNYTTCSVTIVNIKNLLKAGANPNILDAFLTPIIFSCVILNAHQKNQSDQLLKCFINYGVSTNFVDDEGRSVLFHALSINPDHSTCELCLNNKCYTDINAVDTKGNTALLHYLSCQNLSNQNTVVMKLLLESGCNPSVQNKDGNCALHFVTQNKRGLEAKIKLLLQYNVNPSLVNKIGECPLLIVCNLNLEVNEKCSVNLLLKANCDVHVQDCYGNTPLHLMLKSKYCDLDLVKSILDSNADSNAANFNGVTPLILACCLRKPKLAIEVIDILLLAKADPNSVTKSGKNVLFYASEKCIMSPKHTIVLEKLLSLNISLSEEQKDNLIINAIKIYVPREALKTFKIMLNKGILPPKNSHALLHASNVKDPSCAFQLIVMLIKAGVDLSVTDKNGNTALLLVCKNYNCKIHFEIIKFLIDKGVDPTLQNKNGEDALLISINNPNHPKYVFKIVKLILNFGSKKFPTLDAALMCAAGCADTSLGLKLVKLLLNNHAKPTYQNDDGNTALHYAALVPYDSDDSDGNFMVDALLSAGADPNATNNLGQTPLFCALSVFNYNNLVSSALSLFSASGHNPLMQDNKGNTALFYAAEIPDAGCAIGCVKMLCYDIDPSMKNKEGKTAFSIAARRTNDENITQKIQELMLEYPGKPSSEDLEVLFFMCENGTLKFFKKMLPILIEAKMNFYVTDIYGYTPLMLSLRSAHNPLEKMKMLIENIESTTMTLDCTSKHKDTALLIVAKNLNALSANVAYTCIARLLNAGANPNCVTAKGDTPLIFALMQNMHPVYGPKMVEVLLKAGADPSAKNSKNISLIMLAAMHEDVDIALKNIKLLVQAGADIHTKTMRGTNFLSWTCVVGSGYENRHLIMKYLIECGVQNEILQSEFELDSKFDSLLERCVVSLDAFTLFMHSIFEYVSKVGIIKRLSMIKHRIHKVLDLGILKVSPDILSPLTLLVKFDTQAVIRSISGIEYTTREKKSIILSLVKEFVSLGADVSQKLYRFQNQYLQTWSDKLYLPDALFTAAIMGNIESVDFLLDYWPSPPLALLLFLDPFYCSNMQGKTCLVNIIGQIIPVLVKGCPLPLGTELYLQVTELIEEYKHLVADDVIATFQNKHSVVPSLLEMCRLSVRCAIPSRQDFSKKISQLCIPQELIKLLLQPNPRAY